MAAVSYLAYPNLRLESAAGLILSCTYARSSVLYDHGRKTTSAIIKSVSSLLSPKSNDSGGKSLTQGRGKGHGKGKGKSRTMGHAQPVTFFQGYFSLFVALVVTLVLSTVDIGEARWFSDTNDGGVFEGMKEMSNDGIAEVIMEVC